MTDSITCSRHTWDPNNRIPASSTFQQACMGNPKSGPNGTSAAPPEPKLPLYQIYQTWVTERRFKWPKRCSHGTQTAPVPDLPMLCLTGHHFADVPTHLVPEPQKRMDLWPIKKPLPSGQANRGVEPPGRPGVKTSAYIGPMNNNALPQLKLPPA